MREKWENFKVSLTDITEISRKEFLLTMAVCILGGIVFGMLFSPRKSMVIGSNNGNNSGNCHKRPEDKADAQSGEEIEDWNAVEQNDLN